MDVTDRRKLVKGAVDAPPSDQLTLTQRSQRASRSCDDTGRVDSQRRSGTWWVCPFFMYRRRAATAVLQLRGVFS